MSLAKFFASVGCVFAKNFKNPVQRKLKFWFRKREYPESLISSAMRKVRFYNLKIPESLISSAMRKVRFYNLKIKNNGNDNNMKGIQLVVTYHSL